MIKRYLCHLPPQLLCLHEIYEIYEKPLYCFTQLNSASPHYACIYDFHFVRVYTNTTIMPPKRTSTKPARQSTLSFNSKVTKPARTSSKKLDGKATKTKARTITAPVFRDSQDSDVVEIEPPKTSVKKNEVIKNEVIPVKEKEEDKEQEKNTGRGKKEEEKIVAPKISEARITAYYTAILSSRLLAPVHQSELSATEKILRNFDLSSQYGPCIGISRVARWRRAEGLGLKPPMEVLAVALEKDAEKMAAIDGYFKRGEGQ
ncbi:DNA polymerase delta, subunit 4-domain-containing protein [Pyronema omphalodes]|nr:DNA polymerase delta, subunit 4-domain-containing protein [Pyronema omphalodes]